MKQKVNQTFKPLFTESYRYAILMGGRGAGRSTAASQYANAKLVAPEYFRGAIMRYILGDIRNSIYREIIDRATENEILDKLSINDGAMTISYGKNTINAVGFKKSSGDQKAKLKSLANYTTVIIEEADEISEEDFMQLDDSLRTLKSDIKIILLLNPPPKSHWIIRRWFDLEPSEVKDFYIPILKRDATDTIVIRSSYLDNIVNISDASIRNYENYKTTKPDHYYNMIRGLVPEVVRGKIFSGWSIIPQISKNARLVGYGLDFGYTNDPTSIVAIYYCDGGYELDEVCYQTGLSNSRIADIFNTVPDGTIVADSAEPKSIDDLKERGLLVIPAVKGQGSITHGISHIKDQKISVTSNSKNIIKEYENYSWVEDKEGNRENVPKDIYNHAMDAIRYGMQLKYEEPRVEEEIINDYQPMYSDIGI